MRKLNQSEMSSVAGGLTAFQMSAYNTLAGKPASANMMRGPTKDTGNQAKAVQDFMKGLLSGNRRS